MPYQELSELGGTACAQLSDRHLLLLLHYHAVLLLRILGLESLPRERALEAVDEHIRNGLEIVSATLLHAQVVVDAGVPRRACEAPAVPVRDVLQVLGVAVPLGQTEVHAEDDGGILVCANHEIGRLNVPTNITSH